MANRSKRLFEVDRKMELRMRLAAKKANHGDSRLKAPIPFPEPPEKEVVNRLIKKVRVL